jgi:hypothetical protein
MSHRACATLLLAWIAWVHAVFQSKGIDQWGVAGATETLDECKQTAVTSAENSVRELRAKNERGTTYTQTGAVIDMSFASGERATLGFVCLPDTAPDPRGPKAK